MAFAAATVQLTKRMRDLNFHEPVSALRTMNGGNPSGPTAPFAAVGRIV